MGSQEEGERMMGKQGRRPTQGSSSKIRGEGALLWRGEMGEEACEGERERCAGRSPVSREAGL